MPQTNELRVFISSTFRDLQEEREHLIKKIFPEIRSLCRQRGVTFTPIDLRWGLTDEQGALGTIIRTCLEEIDRCRPYFIGIIGDRYGWAPAFHEVAMDPDLFVRYPWIEKAALDDVSITEMEFMHGVVNAPAINGESVFFYRRDGDIDNADDPEKLRRMIERAEASGHIMHGFATVESLGEIVRADLLQMIDETWPTSMTPTPLQLEQRAHAAFSASRRHAYIPQPEHLKFFNTWIDFGTTPLVVVADSGMGKSSLVAWLVDQFRRKNPTAFVIEHYVGASNESGTSAAVMHHCIEEISNRFSIAETIPSNPEQLKHDFPNWLYRVERLASQQGVELLIVLDALNQLDEQGQLLGWLPKTIPRGTHLVVSATAETAYDALHQRGWQELELTPLVDQRLRSSIVVRYLAEFHKSISAAQLSRITSDEKADSPLYLRVVVEELRLHGEHETLDEVIERYRSAADLDDAFQRVLERMEGDFGAVAMCSLMTAIWASRGGLAENDLLEITAMNRLELSRLLLALDYHLLHRDGLLDFFHHYLQHAVERRYLPDDATKHEAHNRLAAHFEPLLARLLDSQSLIARIVSDESAVDGMRELYLVRELAHQYLQIGDHKQLVQLLAPVSVAVLLNRDSTKLEFLGYWRILSEEFSIEDIYNASLTDFRSGNPNLQDHLAVLFSVESLMNTAGRLAVAESLVREAWGLEGVHNDDKKRLRCATKLAAVLINIGNYTEAFTLLEESRELAEKLGDREVLSNVYRSIAFIHQNREELEPALQYSLRSLEIAREGDVLRDVAGKLHNVGNVYEALGNSDAALEYYTEAQQINELIGNRQWLAYNITSIGMLENRKGDYDMAAEKMERGLRVLDELGDRVAYGVVSGNLGASYAGMKRNEDALRFFEAALAAHRESGYLHGLTFWLYEKAKVISELARNEEPLPDYLENYVVRLERIRIIKQSIDLLTECIDISEQLNKPYERASKLRDALYIEAAERA